MVSVSYVLKQVKIEIDILQRVFYRELRNYNYWRRLHGRLYERMRHYDWFIRELWI